MQIAQDLLFTSGLQSAQPQQTQYTVSGLQPLESYYWRVRAQNDSLVGPWSEVWQFATDDDTGIDSPNDLGSVHVFPNPSDGIYSLSVPEQQGSATVEVSNNLGQVVEKENINPGTTQQIDLHRHPAGAYFLLVRTGKDVHRVKLIKR